MARHCDPIREKYSLFLGRYSDQMYLFMGFNLVTTLSKSEISLCGVTLCNISMLHLVEILNFFPLAVQ